MNKDITPSKTRSLPFLEAMDEYIAYLDREKTLTKGYSAPESLLEGKNLNKSY